MYQFTVIFRLDELQGEFNAQMGFELSNKQKLLFDFTGNFTGNE